MNFERAPGIDLDVTNFRASVHETLGPGVGAPSTVMKTDQAWTLQVHWDVVGAAVPSIHGKWRVEGYLESLGAGGEFEIPESDVNMGLASYTVFLAVPAGFVDPHMAPGEPSTPFKLTTTLTAVDEFGHVYPMAGYEEGPIIQFFVGP